MVEKLKISLWDLFTFLVSGVIIVSLLKFYQVEIPFIFNFANSEFLSGFFYAILTYTIGTVFEPISNFIYSQLKRIYEWRYFFLTYKIKKLTEERDEIYYPKVKQIVVEEYNLRDDRTDYYQMARTFLVQRNIETSYMVFLSRFGFYRNLSILAFINAFLFPLCKGKDFSTTTVVLIVLSIFILHLVLYLRGREFYLYTGNEVYRNFIIHKTHAATTPTNNVHTQ